MPNAAPIDRLYTTKHPTSGLSTSSNGCDRAPPAMNTAGMAFDHMEPISSRGKVKSLLPTRGWHATITNCKVAFWRRATMSLLHICTYMGLMSFGPVLPRAACPLRLEMPQAPWACPTRAVGVTAPPAPRPTPAGMHPLPHRPSAPHSSRFLAPSVKRVGGEGDRQGWGSKATQ